jgi:hypothetical protein
MKSAGPDLHVIGLQQRTSELAPVTLQGEDEILEVHGRRMVGKSKTRILLNHPANTNSRR